MTSNTATKAERELNILVKSTPDAIIKEFVPEVLALVDKFGNSGQSGGSAPYTAQAISSVIKKLCMHEPICPIMGIDDEWNVLDYETDMTHQNNRCFAIFKKGDGKAYYSNAITWKTQKDICWSGSALLPNGEKISSRQHIKSFPFEPKKFEIDVIEKEITKDDWEFFIKDESQLNEVFKYYDKYNRDEGHIK